MGHAIRGPAPRSVAPAVAGEKVRPSKPATSSRRGATGTPANSTRWTKARCLPFTTGNNNVMCDARHIVQGLSLIILAWRTKHGERSERPHLQSRSPKAASLSASQIPRSRPVSSWVLRGSAASRDRRTDCATAPQLASTDRSKVMTKHEKIARQLAAELSEKGEQAWRSYVAMALEVDDRLER